MAAVNDSARRSRVAGSGFTIFQWENEPIAFARSIAHTSPTPVGPGATPIQPMDEKHPIEIITPAAVSMGQITLEIFELYGNKVWDRLEHLTGSTDLQEIFERVANTENNIKLVKFVRPPRGSSIPQYREIYHRCVITDVTDGETIEVGTMEVLKQVTVGYTHVTRSDNQPLGI